SLVPLGTYDGGGYGRSEIVAFDPVTDRMFVNNGSQNRIDIISIANPVSPSLVSWFDIGSYGTAVNSVAVGNGFVAAAVESAAVVAANGRRTGSSGKVVMFTPDGRYLNSVAVGVQPDHVSFTSDKTKILVAGEGEPICALNDPSTIADETLDASIANDPLGTVTIIDVSAGALAASPTVLDFSSFDKTALLAEGVRVFFPTSTAAQDLEPEYIAVSPDGTRAWVTLQEANSLAIVDLTNRTVLDVVSLGYKDWSANGLVIDPSDRDGASAATLMNPVAWPNVPLRGMYMPDTIAAFTRGGQTFLATANEGDSRGWSCFNEESRFNDTSGSDSFSSFWTGVSDTNLLNNRADAKLGYLRTTLAFPTVSPLAAMYTYGARSFSIWNANGQLVWDSGSQFEEYIAANYPTCFNSDADTGANDSNTAAQMKASICTSTRADKRSDDKGIEPEALAVGTIGTKSFAFIGFERIGGVAMYDVSDPTAPVFLTYKNPAIDGSTGAGQVDVSPEGMVFVPAQSSPIDKPLLLVANELSGTTTIYEVRTPTPESTSTAAPAVSVLDALPARSLTPVTSGYLPGATLNVTLGGFVPFESVNLIVESTPTVIASGTADSNGSVSLTGNLPSGLASGDHRLSLHAPVSGLGARMTITVAETPAETPATTVPVSTPSVSPGLLPATGAGTDLTPLLAASALGLGLGLLFLRRRSA
ncbi:MAG: choice-of-anchor I family protein, partial [Ilumatobacteraceae bacterium]